MTKVVVCKNGRFTNLLPELILELIEKNSSLIIQEKLSDHLLENCDWRPLKNGFRYSYDDPIRGLESSGIYFTIHRDDDKFRSHPDLIELMQKYDGKICNSWIGEDPQYVIVEIPDDVKWHVEYDINDEYEEYGRELIIEDHRVWNSEDY